MKPKLLFFNFLILPTFVPFVNIEAPDPFGGITTCNSAPEPSRVGPRMPPTASTSINAVVYPFPGSVTVTSTICPAGSVVPSTNIETLPPVPSPRIGTPKYSPGSYSVPGFIISTLSIFLADAISLTIGSFL